MSFLLRYVERKSLWVSVHFGSSLAFRRVSKRSPVRTVLSLLTAVSLLETLSASASLSSYDTVIANDSAAGLRPLARLTSPAILTGANRASFNFGTNSGDGTIEFILEGNPAAGPDGYLAVGENSSSNLRYAQWADTREMGFTQLGEADYLFTPAVSSPTIPTHVTFVWNAVTHTMQLYLNGALAGTRSGVSPNFAMPRGQGWLGATAQGGEPMVGTIHRVTVYEGRVSEEGILAHADAFRGIVRPPAILSFTAMPETIFTPASATLTWNVRDVVALFINDVDLSGKTNLTVSPAVTTTYRLTATNLAGSVSSEVSVNVNPPPIITRFAASRTYCKAGDAITLNWDVSFGKAFSISPGVGDVTAQTIGGAGSTLIHPTASTNYVLTSTSEFGTNTATVSVHIVQPANHLVISEFMADDKSTLADENGRHSGWIEICNPTETTINLAGYFLTDDASNPTHWSFPSTNLAPGSFLVVFASGEDRAQVGRPFHTNFRLGDAGDYLALAGPGLGVVHAFSPVYPPQRPDISYGLLEGDVALQQYFGLPTPGAPNSEVLPPPLPVQFLRPSGVFLEPFNLTLSTPDPNAEIRFTLDGSSPSGSNGVAYVSPIQIMRTTHLRAIAKANGLWSPVSGVSFVKLAPDIASYTSSLPIMVIENFGAGTIPRKGWNSTGAGIKQVPRQTAAWATFERVSGSAALTNSPQMFALTGIRGRGAYSTEWRQKPYSVEAIDEEGSEAEVAPLDMPPHADWVLYFPDPDQSRDPTLLFNTFAYELSRNMGHYSVRFRWVEAFINEDGGDLSLADRRGVYAIVEKVARGKDRLDFERLSPDGSTGSWLLNINRMDPEPDTGWPAPNGATQPWFFHTGGPDRIVQTLPNTAYGSVPGGDLPQQINAFINFENPNGYFINTNQRAAIEGWFRQFENVLYNDATWRDPVNGYSRYLDSMDFADYFVLNVLTRNGDGLLLSMFPWKGGDGKLRMGPAWDYNWSAYYISGGPTGSLLHRSDQLWYPRLFADPDFVQLYIDRWWDARRGPMSNAAMEAIIDRQAAEISPAKALLNGLQSTTEWQSRLIQMKDWLKQRADWIDSNYLRPPTFNQNGGDVPEGFLLVVTAGSGTLYVTTDGTDPRASGGVVAGSARVYAGPLALHSQTLVKARVKSGANWSGLTSALFTTPRDLSNLVVTEIMYDPRAASAWAGSEFEFLELKNVGTNALQLGGFYFSAGIDFVFTNDTRLGPNQFLVLARNAAAFEWKYPGAKVDGLYTGQLNNGGETVRLVTPGSNTVFELTFSNVEPWPNAAAGFGYSAVPINSGILRNTSDGTQWRASSNPGGSPGQDDFLPDNLDTDSDGIPDWQEYLAGTNPTDSASYLRIESVTLNEAGGVTLRFHAKPYRTYSLQFTDALKNGTWSTFAEVIATPVEREEALDGPGSRTNRFYRLVTPKP